jgi:hypothetical protein
VKVLVGCEYSGRVRDAFIAAGHDAMSCDLLPTDRPGPHYQGDVLDVIDREWDLAIFHPDCTYLTRAGQWCLNRPDQHAPRALMGAPRWAAMWDAVAFFETLRDADIPRIAIENPRPNNHAAARIGRPTQVVQPWQFGHGESKATGLWLKNLPPLVPTDIVDGRHGRVHLMSPGPGRAKARSLTYQGIADAMATQWGAL